MYYVVLTSVAQKKKKKHYKTKGGGGGVREIEICRTRLVRVGEGREINVSARFIAPR